MPRQPFGKDYAGNPAESYQRFFVPAIGAPVAEGFMKVAALRPGERVLDVACGTGVVTRLASKSVGEGGVVAGLDLNPGMLAVARATTPAGTTVAWHEASAEAMPFPDASFDAVLCQLGLQFLPDGKAALGEMRRVLAPGGRVVANVPGPTPPAFGILADALARHVGPQAAGFVSQIFSLHDAAELRSLLDDAGFRAVAVESHVEELHFPAPEDFLWQFVRSTPLAGAAAGAEDESLASLERDVVAGWRPLVQDQALVVPVRMLTATARKE